MMEVELLLWGFQNRGGMRNLFPFKNGPNPTSLLKEGENMALIKSKVVSQIQNLFKDATGAGGRFSWDGFAPKGLGVLK